MNMALTHFTYIDIDKQERINHKKYQNMTHMALITEEFLEQQEKYIIKIILILMAIGIEKKEKNM